MEFIAITDIARALRSATMLAVVAAYFLKCSVFKTVAIADDVSVADGVRVLSYLEAVELVRRAGSPSISAPAGAPVEVDVYGWGWLPSAPR